MDNSPGNISYDDASLFFKMPSASMAHTLCHIRRHLSSKSGDIIETATTIRCVILYNQPNHYIDKNIHNIPSNNKILEINCLNKGGCTNLTTEKSY